MPESIHDRHPARLSPDELLAQCDVRRLRRSGPGGQNRNKVETAVALRHRPTGIEAEANERRSQAQNQSAALDRLRVNLALQVRSEELPPAAPSDLWQSRCRHGRVHVSAAHDDFPPLLAEALDFIVGHAGDIKAAADALGCTPSQLVRFLKREPRSLALVNARRAAGGQRRLR